MGKDANLSETEMPSFHSLGRKVIKYSVFMVKNIATDTFL